ncbi:MAG: DUF1016 N-terminal domain-containing protein [Syntrophales bacterium]
MSKSALKPLESLVGEIKTLIEQSRQQVAVTVNATMTMLYWQIGRRINQEVLKEIPFIKSNIRPTEVESECRTSACHF